MSNRFCETMGVVLAMVFFFAGCEKGYVSDKSDRAAGLDPDKISAPSGFAAEAFDAAGGVDAWTETQKMGFDCVVTFYESDGSFYLTPQRYDIYLWSNAIEISGREPAGDYAWLFSNGALTELHGAEQIDTFPPAPDRICFAQAILTVTTAPVTFLTPPSQFKRQDAAIKKQGKWYYPIHKTGESSGQTVFYQDRETRLVSMVRVPCLGTENTLIVRGYDYQAIEKNGPIVPSRIEIFSTDVAGVTEKRLVKIDCHTMVQMK